MPAVVISNDIDDIQDHSYFVHGAIRRLSSVCLSPIDALSFLSKAPSQSGNHRDLPGDIIRQLDEANVCYGFFVGNCLRSSVPGPTQYGIMGEINLLDETGVVFVRLAGYTVWKWRAYKNRN